VDEDALIKETKFAMILFLPMGSFVLCVMAALYLQLIRFPQLGPSSFRNRLELLQNLVLAHSDVLSGLFKITLSFAQCIGAMRRFDRVIWPRFFSSFLEILNALNLELFAVIPAECLSGSRLGFIWELLATMSLPPLIFVGVLVLNWATRFLTCQNRTAMVWWVRFEDHQVDRFKERVATLENVTRCAYRLAAPAGSPTTPEAVIEMTEMVSEASMRLDILPLARITPGSAFDWDQLDLNTGKKSGGSPLRDSSRDDSWCGSRSERGDAYTGKFEVLVNREAEKGSMLSTWRRYSEERRAATSEIAAQRRLIDERRGTHAVAATTLQARWRGVSSRKTEGDFSQHLTALQSTRWRKRKNARNKNLQRKKPLIGLTAGVRQAWRDFHAPRSYKLITVCLLFAYPALCRKTLASFDCMPASETIELLRDDPAIVCSKGLYSFLVSCAIISLCLFCLGLPVLAWAMSWRYHRLADRTLDPEREMLEFQRVEILVASYKERFWYMESISLLHKFFFTGMIQLMWPDEILQIWAGCIVCTAFLTLCIVYQPYRLGTCQWVQVASLLQLLMTYMTAFVFFEDPRIDYSAVETDEVASDRWGVLLVCINLSIFVIVVVFMMFEVYNEREQSSQRLRVCPGSVKLEASSRDRVVVAPRLESEDFHFFLSHVWGTGQDQMRIIKLRLTEMVPRLKVFLGACLRIRSSPSEHLTAAHVFGPTCRGATAPCLECKLAAPALFSPPRVFSPPWPLSECNPPARPPRCRRPY
jgi:hypothetical protein